MPTHSQLFPIDYDELLKKPYVLSHVQKKQTVKELEKFVSQAESRSQHFMDIYQRHLLLGDEYRGFKIVAINILREARAIKKFLSEQKQSA